MKVDKKLFGYFFLGILTYFIITMIFPEIPRVTYDFFMGLFN